MYLQPEMCQQDLSTKKTNKYKIGVAPLINIILERQDLSQY